MTRDIPQETTDRAVGRPPRISRDDIADAALAIGLSSVKMKAVGERLGVDHSSLYRHVKGRDDLIFVALDRAVSKLDWEQDSPDWRDFLRSMTKAVWALCDAYPGLASALRTMKTIPPSVIAGYARACRRLEEHGFAMDDAVLIIDGIMDMTVGCASRWEQLLENDGAAAETMLNSLETANDAATAPYGARMKELMSGAPKEWWQRKLNLMIEGAAALLVRNE
nr:TetR/AcrR family transcriptional regulator C-terminal domain-containing protein [uncultured Celeribacter sp.]